MQYKKDEIKEKIDLSARKVFAQQGYKKTTISAISKEAGVSVGNIYRYYKGKDHIFYSVVPKDFIENLKILLIQKITNIGDKDLKDEKQKHEFWLLNDEFIAFLVKHREEILIVFYDQETEYKNTKTEVIHFLMDTLKKHYKEQYDLFLYKNKDDLIIKIIYENLIHMMLRILEEAKTFQEVKNHLKCMNVYHMFGMVGLLK